MCITNYTAILMAFYIAFSMYQEYAIKKSEITLLVF